MLISFFIGQYCLKLKYTVLKRNFLKPQIEILYKIISDLINIPSSEIPTIFIWLNSEKLNANNIIGMSTYACTYNIFTEVDPLQIAS